MIPRTTCTSRGIGDSTGLIPVAAWTTLLDLSAVFTQGHSTPNQGSSCDPTAHSPFDGDLATWICHTTHLWIYFFGKLCKLKSFTHYTIALFFKCILLMRRETTYLMALDFVLPIVLLMHICLLAYCIDGLALTSVDGDKTNQLFTQNIALACRNGLPRMIGAFSLICILKSYLWWWLCVKKLRATKTDSPETDCQT